MSFENLKQMLIFCLTATENERNKVKKNTKKENFHFFFLSHTFLVFMIKILSLFSKFIYFND